jgi:hypothetical protein
MEPLKFREKSAVCHNRTVETRMFVPVGNVQCQLPEGLRTEAERAVNVTFHRCGLSGVRFAAIHEEHAPRRRRMPDTAIGVLLDALLDDADYKMFMRMTREPVLDVMRVNQFGVIRMTEPIKANPLRKSRHREQVSGVLTVLLSPQF